MVTAFSLMILCYAMAVYMDMVRDWVPQNAEMHFNTTYSGVKCNIRFLPPEEEEPVTREYPAGVFLPFLAPQVVESNVLTYLDNYKNRPNPIDWGMELWEQYAQGMVDAQAFPVQYQALA